MRISLVPLEPGRSSFKFLIFEAVMVPASGRPMNAYIREDRILPHLRARGVTLTYDPAAGTLQAGTSEAIKTIIRKAS